ncbi:MAG: hypothetical protein Q4C10_07240 [Clostridia bacterium]|nr:hypothetical protein [Clostridia bacterium]
MSDLVMLGFTVVHFETELQPEVVQFDGKSDKGMAINCDAYIPGDGKHSVLRIQISICGYLPGEKPLNERKPFVKVDGEFLFNFESVVELENSEMEATVKTVGLQTAIPVLRGLLVGVCNMLNLPPVFSFPPVGPEDIDWDSEEDE